MNEVIEDEEIEKVFEDMQIENRVKLFREKHLIRYFVFPTGNETVTLSEYHQMSIKPKALIDSYNEITEAMMYIK